MNKLKKTDQPGIYIFVCPGCDQEHQIWVEGSTFHMKWGWNGSMEKPTFTPSLLIQWQRSEPPVTSENLEEYKRAPWEQKTVKKVCHSFITDGKIQYLDDCTHSLKGQTVELPNI